MHISVALGKQCVAFFGPTDHKRNGPYSGPINSPMNHLVVRSGLQCSPCWTLKTVGANPACIYGDTRCLTQFDLDAAWPNIHEFIGTVVHNDKK